MAYIHFTEPDKHYFNGTGAYQSLVEDLTNKFVPERGRSNCLIGEVIRAVNRLYYEYANNGNSNLIDYREEWIDCPDCGRYDDCCETCGGDGGWYDYEPTTNAYYEQFFEIILYFLKNYGSEEAHDFVDNLKNTVLYESGEFLSLYDKMIDYVAFFISSQTDNKEEIPSWYTNDLL